MQFIETCSYLAVCGVLLDLAMWCSPWLSKQILRTLLCDAFLDRPRAERFCVRGQKLVLSGALRSGGRPLGGGGWAQPC